MNDAVSFLHVAILSMTRVALHTYDEVLVARSSRFPILKAIVNAERVVADIADDPE
jgi:hypothetical protein